MQFLFKSCEKIFFDAGKRPDLAINERVQDFTHTAANYGVGAGAVSLGRCRPACWLYRGSDAVNSRHDHDERDGTNCKRVESQILGEHDGPLFFLLAYYYCFRLLAILFVFIAFVVIVFGHFCGDLMLEISGFPAPCNGYFRVIFRLLPIHSKMS